MRNLHELDKYRDRSQRVIEFFGSDGDDTCGVFNLPSVVDAGALHVVAACGRGWDHVSVSRRTRCPTWAEMEQIKRAFFKEDETAIQYHVPAVDHINMHPYCLHLWRPNDGTGIPRPPHWMIGI